MGREKAFLILFYIRKNSDRDIADLESGPGVQTQGAVFSVYYTPTPYIAPPYKAYGQGLNSDSQEPSKP